MDALSGRIQLTWSLPATPLTCSGTTIVDLAGYRIFRSTDPAFMPSNSSLLAEIGKEPTTYVDWSVVNCRPYYYVLQATDLTKICTVGSTEIGMSTSTIAPAAPTEARAERTSPRNIRVSWKAVEKDADSPAASIVIDTFKIYRAFISMNSDAQLADYDFVGRSTPPALTFSDDSAPPEQRGQRLCYKVTAVDDCPNESAKSRVAEASCSFKGESSLIVTYDNSAIPLDKQALSSAPKRVSVTTTGPDEYVSAQLVVTKSGGVQEMDSTILSGSPWVFDWNPRQGRGTYTVTVTVSNATGCLKTFVQTWKVTSASI